MPGSINVPAVAGGLGTQHLSAEATSLESHLQTAPSPPTTNTTYRYNIHTFDTARSTQHISIRNSCYIHLPHLTAAARPPANCAAASRSPSSTAFVPTQSTINTDTVKDCTEKERSQSLLGIPPQGRDVPQTPPRALGACTLRPPDSISHSAHGTSTNTAVIQYACPPVYGGAAAGAEGIATGQQARQPARH